MANHKLGFALSEGVPEVSKLMSGAIEAGCGRV